MASSMASRSPSGLTLSGGRKEERLVAEGADLVLYTCEEVPLRDVAAAYRFFERIGLDAHLIYGESSRVKVFRVQGDYERIVAAIATSASGSEAPGWAQS